MGGDLSLNKNVDLEACDEVYPLGELPTIHSMGELACVQKVLHFPAPISGASVDVNAAFNRTTENPAHSRLTASQVKVELTPGEWHWCALYYCVMIFGYTRAGHIYAVFGNALNWRHNRGRSAAERSSYTYCDDGMIIDRETPAVMGGPCTETRMADYVRDIRYLFGPDGSQEKKQVLWENRVMLAIGWLLDLNYDVWRVTPKPRALLKMYAALHVRIPLGCSVVSAATLLSVLGLLRWYTVGLPLGCAFLGSLNSCLYDLKNRGLVYIPLSEAAMSDLDFFRAIISYARINPRLLGASIDHIRTNVVIDVAIYSDACTSMGAGSFSLAADTDELSPDHQLCGNPDADVIILSEHIIRWSVDEFEWFEKSNVHINVLELFGMFMEIILSGNSLKGKAVKVYLDNTSAVSWLTKSRSACPFASTLMQILSVYCCFMDIALFPWHIKGELNVRADFNSRSDTLRDSQVEPVVVIKEVLWWKSLSRVVACRQVLLQLASAPYLMRLDQVLLLVEHLLPGPGLDT
jgi:hypothetical protein